MLERTFGKEVAQHVRRFERHVEAVQPAQIRFVRKQGTEHYLPHKAEQDASEGSQSKQAPTPGQCPWLQLWRSWQEQGEVSDMMGGLSCDLRVDQP